MNHTPQKKATLQDVAIAAGVSTATVSRCLNQPDKVREDVRTRINTAINQLGYVPHGAARALASRRSRTIGAVVPTIDNAIFSEAIQYLQRGLAKAGYTLLLASSGYSPEAELQEVRVMLSRGIDGLVLVGAAHLPEVYEAISQQQIPHVNLWSYNPDSEHSCIGLDNRKAGSQLARHLFGLGHQHIGMVTAFLQHNDRVQQRLLGVRDYWHSQGLSLPDDQIVECRYSGDQARQALLDLHQRHPQLTAIICSNDILALGVLSAAHELGLAVPAQLSVTGFDNLEIISVLRPALTTMHVPSRRMGQHAANYLLRQLEAQTVTVERLELEAKLMVRETTGLARNSS